MAAGTWDGKAPIALVPTAYPQMTVARVRELKKIGLLIWGNHAIRASVGAMRKTFAQIRKEGGIVIGVGIGAYGVDDDNRAMYQEFIDCKNPSELPSKMASLLRSLTMRGIIGEEV